MSRTTMMSRPPLAISVTQLDTRAPRRLARRFLDWLHAQCATSAEIERRVQLDRAVDHCDLEWRIRELDRRWAHSGFGIGGSRY